MIDKITAWVIRNTQRTSAWVKASQPTNDKNTTPKARV